MPSILSADLSTQLKLVKQIMSLNYRTTDFFSEYSDCFRELGLVPEKHHIQVNPDISPVIHYARRIPLVLRDKVDIELDKMLKLGIKVPVNEPTEWDNQLVVTEKPNEKLRICLDPYMILMKQFSENNMICLLQNNSFQKCQVQNYLQNLIVLTVIDRLQ